MHNDNNEKEIRIDRVESKSAPEQDGFFPLQVLSEKYGYAKDYIGWLARTGRIQAIRYGKYGQWYASETALAEYRQSLTLANQERYNSNRNKLKAILASAEVSGSRLTDNAEAQSDKRQVPPVLSFPVPSVPQKNDVILNFEAPVLYNQSSNDVSSQRDDRTAQNKGSLSVEPKRKPNPKRLNTALALVAILLALMGGIFVYKNPDIGSRALSMARNWVKRPIAFFFGGEGQPTVTLTPTPSGLAVISTPAPTPMSTPESAVDGGGATTVDRDVITKIIRQEIRLTQDLTPEQLRTIYDRISGTDLRIDSLASELTNLRSSIVQPPGFNPFPQVMPVSGQPNVVISPNEITTGILTVTNQATIQTLSVVSNLGVDTNTFFVNSGDNRVGVGTNDPNTTFEVVGTASASQYYGAGLSDCDSSSNNALQWDDGTGLFSCTTVSGGGGGGSALQVKEGLTSTLNPVASISFDAGGFAVTPSGSAEVVVKIDYTNGPASRAIDQTITGFWEFRSGASFSNDVEFWDNPATPSLFAVFS
ncbi:MAG: hypothetical protein UW79_C0002G0001, partial [Candidatus Yanofskybacteria bacterium GW2011_GWA2_44_9]